MSLYEQGSDWMKFGDNQKPQKIHPMDLRLLIPKDLSLIKIELKRPWWSWLIPGFSGPYKSVITIDGVSYEQNVNAPRKKEV